MCWNALTGCHWLLFLYIHGIVCSLQTNKSVYVSKISAAIHTHTRSHTNTKGKEQHTGFTVYPVNVIIRARVDKPDFFGILCILIFKCVCFFQQTCITCWCWFRRKRIHTETACHLASWVHKCNKYYFFCRQTTNNTI